MCGFGSDGAAALLSACSFVCCCSHQFLFPCLEVFFQSIPPLCKALTGHSVNVYSLHVSYIYVFVSKVRAACGSSAQSQHIVEDVFWNAIILHTASMPQPSQSSLSKQSVHTGKTSTRQDITVGYFVMPGYSQDTANASQVEWVEPSLLPGIRSSCSAAMQQCADNTGIVDCHLCLGRYTLPWYWLGLERIHQVTHTIRLANRPYRVANTNMYSRIHFFLKGYQFY